MLLIVDMLRGFMEEGFPLYCGGEARKIIPNIAKLVEENRFDGDSIVYIADCHSIHDKEFQTFPQHCINGTPGAQIIKELRPVHVVCNKATIDPFYKTNVESVVFYRNPRHRLVTVVGVCTDICVLYAVAGLRLRGYPVAVYSNCVASFNQENHEYALKHMEGVLGAEIKGELP